MSGKCYHTMKTSLPTSKDGRTFGVHRNSLVLVMLVAFVALCEGLPLGRAQQSDNDSQGEQVQTRGPVHEAFAGIISYNPEPGVVVTKAPPEPIEEVSPEERPEGDNVAWIPGYWAWDDERNDFLWISGTWRALPPGREWMAGYWTQTAQGYQWISGYWADANIRETAYLPAPPATVETGPNIDAPSPDYSWTPGCWIWYRGRYAWRPGYWTEGRADWDWIPASYVWTPRGYLFVDGYWDYPLQRRGILFAPIFFESAVHARRGYRYSPSIAIDLDVFTDHLFLRPSYHHYYFGDYYARNYAESGIYASISFQSDRRGYDPFYSRERWEHRQDREWEHRDAASYQYRRDNESARPPRTWVSQRNNNVSVAVSSQNHLQVAISINQLAARKEHPVRLQPVARDERQALEHRSHDVQASRDQRRTLEAKPEAASSRQADRVAEPAKVQLPRSPIAAKPLGELGRNQTPPTTPKAPKPDTSRQQKSEPSIRQPNQEQRNQPNERGQPVTEKKIETNPGNTPPQARTIQPESQPHGTDSSVKAEKESPQKAHEAKQKEQQDAERRAKDAAAKASEDSQRNAREIEKKSRQESEQQAKALAQKSQEESQRNAQELKRQAQQESDRRAGAAEMKAAEDSQRNAREAEKKVQQESEQNARAAALRAQEESLRNKQQSEERARKQPIPPAKKRPVTEEKDAPNREKRNPERDDKRKPDDAPAP